MKKLFITLVALVTGASTSASATADTPHTYKVFRIWCDSTVHANAFKTAPKAVKFYTYVIRLNAAGKGRSQKVVLRFDNQLLAAPVFPCP